MSLRKLVLPTIAVVTAGVGAWYGLNLSRSEDDTLRVSGNIEATQVDVSFEMPGRVKTREVDEGDKVSPGQVVATLDFPDRKVLQAEIDLQEANLREARSALELANSNFSRAQQLLPENAISKQDYDQFKNTVLLDEAKIEQVKASLEMAKTRLGYAVITAPMAGVVLSKNIEPGEYVAPGTPVVTMADLKNIWLRAYVDEPDVGRGRVKWGQKAEVTTDAYPGKSYKGRISFISSEAEFTPKTVQTPKERVKLVYRIKIDIENTNLELKPGMPADAIIEK
ncbi:MAG: efflux RND transporter periplasmic adaptor subunit [Thermoguttaceae bacterium]|jgi:HlyD family secretion protein